MLETRTPEMASLISTDVTLQLSFDRYLQPDSRRNIAIRLSRSFSATQWRHSISFMFAWRGNFVFMQRLVQADLRCNLIYKPTAFYSCCTLCTSFFYLYYEKGIANLEWKLIFYMRAIKQWKPPTLIIFHYGFRQHPVTSARRFALHVEGCIDHRTLRGLSLAVIVDVRLRMYVIAAAETGAYKTRIRRNGRSFTLGSSVTTFVFVSRTSPSLFHISHGKFLDGKCFIVR